MAYYKYLDYLQEELPDQGPLYDRVFEPGVPAPVSGVYRCDMCWKSSPAIRSRPLPSFESGHVHSSPTDPIRWRLVVRADLVGG